jgi:uncharacterized protein YlaI
MCECIHELKSAKHIYGVYEIAGKKRDIPMNEVYLCEQCGKDLYEKISQSVAAGHMHYEVSKLNDIHA